MNNINEKLDQMILDKEIPTVDLENKITTAFQVKSPSSFRKKRLVILIVLILLLFTISYASGKISFNDDGSVSLYSATGDKKWIIDKGGSPDTRDVPLKVASSKLYNYLNDLEKKENEYVFGYYEYSHEADPIFFGDDNASKYSIEGEKDYFSNQQNKSYISLIPAIIPESFSFYSSEFAMEMSKSEYEKFKRKARINSKYGEIYYKFYKKSDTVSHNLITYTAKNLTDESLTEWISIRINHSEGIMSTSPKHISNEIITLDRTTGVMEILAHNHVAFNAVFEDVNVSIFASLDGTTKEILIQLMNDIGKLLQ